MKPGEYIPLMFGFCRPCLNWTDRDLCEKCGVFLERVDPRKMKTGYIYIGQADGSVMVIPPADDWPDELA